MNSSSESQNAGQFPSLSDYNEGQQHEWLGFVLSLSMNIDPKITRNCYRKIFRISREFNKATLWIKVLSIIQKKLMIKKEEGQKSIFSASYKFFMISLIKKLRQDQNHNEYAQFLKNQAKILELQADPNKQFLAKKINKFVLLIETEKFNDQQGIKQVFSSLNQLEQNRQKNRIDSILFQSLEAQIINIYGNLTEKEKKGITPRKSKDSVERPQRIGNERNPKKIKGKCRTSFKINERKVRSYPKKIKIKKN